MKRLINALRERMHRTCTEMIDAQHGAVVKSAEAHADAAAELIAVRAENADLTERVNSMARSGYRMEEEASKADEKMQTLEEELAAAHNRADQADANPREMAQALAAVLGCDPNADQAVERLREQGLDEVMERFFELTALRTGLEHVVECPALEVGERVAETARRMVNQANARSRELQGLGAETSVPAARQEVSA